jgi:hypothetical protein
VPNHPSQAELNKEEWDEKWGQPFQESDDEEYYDPEEELYEDKVHYITHLYSIMTICD